VEVGNDDASGGDEVDQGFARFHRLEGGKPDPACRRAGLESLEERHEALSPTPERREMNPAEDDLGDPLRSEGVDRLLDLGRRSAALAAAERRDDAEGTTPAASVLDFQERARAPRPRGPRDGRAKDLIGGNAERGDLSREEPREHVLDQADESGRRRVPRDEIDLGAPREAVRVPLGEASRHCQESGGMLPTEAPHQPERVTIGTFRDGAGMEDQDVGGLSRTHWGKARSLEKSCQAGRLDLADLAAENTNVISSRGASGQAVRAGKHR
jgi:hypothetical protein